MTRVARWWWLRLPLAVARRLPNVAAALADGVHLLRWPVLAALAPLGSLALGVAVGARQAGATYTASFLVMATLLSLGIMSVQLGAWGAIGYALGDFWLRAQPWSTPDGLPALLVTRVPLVLSYALLALLVVGMPFVVRATGSAASSSTVVPQHLRAVAGQGAAVLSAGLLTITWGQATAVLIRPVFTWPGGQPAAADIMWLQQRGWVLGLLAVALTLARGDIERRALLGRVGTVAARLRVALGVVRVRPVPRAPRALRAVLSAGAFTFLMAGLLTGWLDALVLFAFFLGLAFARRALQQARPGWLQALQRVPALLRLAAALGLGYLASRAIIAGLWGSTQTFLPVLAATCVSVTLTTTALAPEPGRAPRVGARRAPGRGTSVAAVVVLATLLLVVPADPVLADNCGTLSDCFRTVAVALAVAAAIALVIALLIGTGGGGAVALAGGGALSGGAASATAAAATNAALAAAAAAAAAGIASQIALMAGDGTPGSNQAQNRQFNDAVRSAEGRLGRRLSKAERRRVHDEISGENLGYQEIVETILQMFGG